MEPIIDPEAKAALMASDRAHVFYPWSAQAGLNPMAIAGAEGSFVYDYDGNEFLDISCQLVFTNIGHQHPRVVEAIKAQADRLCTVNPAHANDMRAEAARLIVSHAPERFSHVFFTNGGTEAVEHAVRMARVHTGRPKVLSRYRSYHGGTYLSVNLTGDTRRFPTDTGTAGVVHFFGPFLYRSEFDAATEAEECERALRHLEHTIEMEGPETIAAIILETIPGTAGIMVPPEGYLAGLRALCDRHGIVWIADEVMAGFGRAGQWFAVDRHGARPDLITFAKGVNSGYVPLGGVILSEEVAGSFAERPYPGGLTYSGHPLACAAAVATIRLMEDEGLVEHARRIGDEILRPGLAQLAERHPVIGEVRGEGVFFALDLVKDQVTKEGLAPYGASSAGMNDLVAACKANGLLPFTNYNRLHVLPPITVSEAEATMALERLDLSLGAADAHYVG
jgi:taurine--2-oxoglutarate transaminase